MLKESLQEDELHTYVYRRRRISTALPSLFLFVYYLVSRCLSAVCVDLEDGLA